MNVAFPAAASFPTVLPEGGLVADHIQHIVDDLEREADVEAELPQGIAQSGVAAPRARRRPRSSTR